MLTNLLLFSLFILALAVLGFAAIRIFTTKDAEGRTQPVGCFMGCLLAVALGVIGFAGLGALVVSLLGNSVSHGIESLGVRSVTLVSDDRPDDPPVEPFHDPRRPLHVIFEIDGPEASTERVVRMLEEVFDVGARIEVSRFELGPDSLPGTEPDVSGSRERTVVDVALPVDSRDLREIERDLRQLLLPNLKLEEGVRVRMKTTQDW